MYHESASPVRLNRTPQPDTTRPVHARTWRRLWLLPSPLPSHRPPDVMDKLLPVIARAMYREGLNRDRAHADDLLRAQLATDEGAGGRQRRTDLGGGQ